MLKGQKSFRSIVIAATLTAVTAITATASWTDYINPFAYFAPAIEATETSVSSDSLVALPSETPSISPLFESKKNTDGIEESNDAISVTTYPFTTSSGAALEDMSSGTTSLVGSASDDGASVLSDIGFPFYFNGVAHTRFAASANGYIRLGTTVNNPGGGVDFTNSLGSLNQAPVIAPYWDDLATGTTGNVTYKVVGSAPNRKMVVQWFVTVPRATGAAANATYQAWLYETTGQIEFVYGSGMVANATNSGASIGIATAAATLASITLNATSTSSTCSYATANNANTIAITSGTKFTFTPTLVTPAAPTSPAFSNIGTTSLTLTWTDNASNELGFPIFISTDNVTFNLLGTAGAAAGTGTTTGAIITGLLPNTTYYFQIYSVTEAQPSTPLNTAGQLTNSPIGSMTALDVTSSENFNGLANSGGPFTWTDNVSVPSTYASDATYTVGTGSSNTGALYSFGVAGTNSITERALGTLASGGTTRYTAVRLVNSTGSPIGSLDVNYVGEQWRAANTSAQTLSFQYQVANAGVITDANAPASGWTGDATLNFTSPNLTTVNAIDGNALANRTTKSSTITFGAPVAVGQEIWIRWVDADDTGNDHALAVDDLSVTPHGVPAGPGTVQFSATSYTDLEGNTATITVNRTGGSSGAISVDYATGGGTATGGAACTAGVDYITPTPGILTWADTETAGKTFTVQLCNDTDSPETESLDLTLSNPIGTSITGTNPAPLNITDVPPPLSGTYNVPGDYPSLTNNDGIFKALNDSGASGAIDIIIAADLLSETGTHALNAIVGNHAVVIKPTGGLRNISGTTNSNAMIRTSGASNVTIDGSLSSGTDRNLTITNLAITAPQVVRFGSVGTTPIVGITLKNTTITNGANTSTAVVIADNGGASAGYFEDVNIENNDIRRAYIGIYGFAAVSGTNGSDTVFSKNILDNTGADSIAYCGLYMQGINGGTISENSIGNFNGGTDEDDTGIWLASGTTNSTVERNTVKNLNYTGTGGYGVHGIKVTSAVTNANDVVKNNFIYGLSGDGFSYTSASFYLDNVFGIVASGGTQTGVKIYNNSVYLSGNTLNQTNALSAGIAIDTGSSVEVINNAVVNNLGRLTATGYGAVGIWRRSATAVLTAASNNTYYVNPTGSGVKAVGQINTTASTTIANWQTANPGSEVDSKDINPEFVSTSDLHLSNPSNLVVGGGTPIAGVTVDYDNDPRPGTAPDIGADEIVGYQGGPLAAGSYYNVAIGVGALGGDVTVRNTLYLQGDVNGGGFTTTLGCDATVVGAGPSNFVHNGSVRKDFCSAGTFSYPVGNLDMVDGAEYSPAEATVTALGVTPSSLTVNVVDTNLTPFDPNDAISRHWNLTESGDLTATLRFFYLDEDVTEAGDEVDYRIWRLQTGGITTDMCGGACVDDVNNILGPTIPVSHFSGWTGSRQLTPSSSAASVSGRITTASGQGIRGAAIVITGNSLPTPIVVKSGTFGYFQVDGLETGETYVVTVVSKRFTFSQPSRVINLSDSINDVDFIANPLE